MVAIVYIICSEFEVCRCVCVCVCIYVLPPWRHLPSARCLRHIWRAQINDLVLWILFWVLLPGFFIFLSENVVITSKDEKSNEHELERKRYDILVLQKDDLLVQDVSRPRREIDKWRKNTKNEEATLISILLLWIRLLALT